MIENQNSSRETKVLDQHEINYTTFRHIDSKNFTTKLKRKYILILLEALTVEKLLTKLTENKIRMKTFSDC